METRLTLKMDSRLIEKAKRFARSKGTSLSVLIGDYLLKVTDVGKKKRKVPAVVKDLSGAVKLPPDYDHKKDYSDYLAEKYR